MARSPYIAPFVLFMYDPNYEAQTFITFSDTETELLERIEQSDETMYYSIYKYKTKSFYLGFYKEADTYELHKVVKGKKNSGIFPYSPYRIAHNFKDSSPRKWTYETHI